MRGEIIGVWSEMWRQVWRKLADHRDAPEDLFCELYRELNKSLVVKLDPATSLAAIVDNKDEARIAFRNTKAKALAGELAAVEFLERAHTVIEDFGSEALTNKYFLLIRGFLDKYSLRYDLRRPCSLHPTLPGVFARLINDLRAQAMEDADIYTSLRYFEDAFRDIKADPSPNRIGLLFVRHMNLLEALGQKNPALKGTTLGKMSKEMLKLPHSALETGICDMVAKVYGFSSDYPDIRHKGTPASKQRDLGIEDVIAVSVMLSGILPYINDGCDPHSAFYGEAK